MKLPAPLVKAETLLRGLSGENVPPWSARALKGFLVEVVDIPSSAALSVAGELVRGAQEHGEPCVWAATEASIFFPPDMADCGVDLEHLMVVRVPELSAVARSVEYLVRSGGFGLVVADFTIGTAREVDSRFGGRVVRLAREYNTAVICLTREGSLGSLVAVRAEARRERVAEGSFRTVVNVIKDRRYGPGERYTEFRRGPDGVR